jgi:hypothetical protein
MEATTLERIKTLLVELRGAIDELDEPLPQVKAESVDETKLTGIVGRPEMKVVKGRKLFTAGLGIQEGKFTTWLSLEAWGEVAEQAQELQRGDNVTVKGLERLKTYVNGDGVMKSSKVFTVREFVGETPATSA